MMTITDSTPKHTQAAHGITIRYHGDCLEFLNGYSLIKGDPVGSIAFDISEAAE